MTDGIKSSPCWITTTPSDDFPLCQTTQKKCFYDFFQYYYTYTRGPWSAMPALIKVDEIRTKLAKKLDTEIIQNWCNFSGKRHSVSVHLSKQPPKRPFSLGTPQLDEAMDQSGTPLGLMLRPTSICQGAICQV